MDRGKVHRPKIAGQGKLNGRRSKEKGGSVGSIEREHSAVRQQSRVFVAPQYGRREGGARERYSVCPGERL